ncbi:MAG: ABC transporter permease subunit [Paenibacillaceae bacterium]
MGRKGAGTNKIILLALTPFLVWIIAFEAVPVLSMLLSSFQSDNDQGFTLGHYITMMTGPIYQQAIKNSITIAFFSSVAGTFFALFCAYSITRFTRRRRDQLLTFTNMVTNFSGVPLAFSYIILLGSNGMFTLLFQKLGWQVLGSFDPYSWAGLTIVYIYFQIPMGIMLLYPAYYGIREEWREGAAILGASNRKFWLYIGLPTIMPSVLGTFVILFANALGAYTTAYALSINFNLLPIRIGKLVSGDVFARPELGSALAVLLAITMLLALYINERMVKLTRRR